MSDEKERGARGHRGVRSLHERIDELHRLVIQRLEPEAVHTAGEWLQTEAGSTLHAARTVPAWQRRTKGELRWPVTATVAVVVTVALVVSRAVNILQLAPFTFVFLPGSYLCTSDAAA